MPVSYALPLTFQPWPGWAWGPQCPVPRPAQILSGGTSVGLAEPCSWARRGLEAPTEPELGIWHRKPLPFSWAERRGSRANSPGLPEETLHQKPPISWASADGAHFPQPSVAQILKQATYNQALQGRGGQAGMTGTWLPAQVAPLTSPPTQVAQWPLRAPSFLDGLVCSAVNRAGKQSCPGKFWNWRGLREADPTWGGGYWVPPSLLSLLPFKLIPHTAWPSLPQGELWALLNPAYRPKGQRKQPERAPMGQGWDTVSNKRISNYNSFIKWISTKPTQLEINNWINKGGQLFLMEEF